MAAIFATAIIAIIPSVNFSGLLVPVSSLTGSGRFIGLMFPGGVVTADHGGRVRQGAGFADLWLDILVLLGFAAAFIAAAVAFLHKRSA